MLLSVIFYFIHRRLKVLSKTQTAFLKSYLHNKLSAGAALVSKTLEVISASDSQNVCFIFQ